MQARFFFSALIFIRRRGVRQVEAAFPVQARRLPARGQLV